ncbi:MAG: 50S ribosomal protein L11 methyltransferase, partial [Spirochaetota bacterium]
MPNDFFRFKQFTIRQDRCAMKVGTDGVLLGAWADIGGCRSVLDIGAGTGLLSLICAQRSKADITGIELDSDAARQAMENAA